MVIDKALIRLPTVSNLFYSRRKKSKSAEKIVRDFSVESIHGKKTPVTSHIIFISDVLGEWGRQQSDTEISRYDRLRIHKTRLSVKKNAKLHKMIFMPI